MMATAAQYLSIVAGLWLIGLSLFMLAAPRRALKALAAMGGTPTVHFGEMAVRAAAGTALVLAAAASRFPLAIVLVGWFLIASAAVLTMLPRRWHAAYSTWWAQRIPVPAVRLVALLSLIAGAVLIRAMI
jgi:hypothetical protein